MLIIKCLVNTNEPLPNHILIHLHTLDYDYTQTKKCHNNKQESMITKKYRQNQTLRESNCDKVMDALAFEKHTFKKKLKAHFQDKS